MIKEAYVSFEIARLLKEKDFNEACEHQYYVIDEKLGTYNTTDRSRNPERYIDAPTHQMAMAWFRKRGLSIEIRVKYRDDASPIYEYSWYIYRADGNKYHKTLFYEYYEDAVEAALRYCLEEAI